MLVLEQNNVYRYSTISLYKVTVLAVEAHACLPFKEKKLAALQILYLYLHLMI
jgi:hypothetical protein